MRSNLERAGVAMAVALGAAACEQAPAPEKAAPPPAAAQVDPSLRHHAGETYSTFAAAVHEYAPDALGLAAGDRARVWRAMAAGQAGTVLQGGGTEALVFTGCAAEGCAAGRSVVAVDLGTGDAFVGVQDAGGADILEPNDRLEALLRLNSPSRSLARCRGVSSGAAALILLATLRFRALDRLGGLP